MNLRLTDAPSATVAITFRLHDNSRMLTAFQNKVNICEAEAPSVAKFAKLKERGFFTLLTMNTIICDASFFHAANFH